MARDATVVACVALLCYLPWAAQLEFQIDDWWLLPRAGELTAETAALTVDPERLVRGGDPSLDTAEHHNFQPVLWALFAGVRALAGEPITPGPYHACCVLLHVIAAVLVLRWLRRATGPLPALGAAMWFAVGACGAQAVSWISASAHILVVIFGLLAFNMTAPARTNGRTRPFVGAGVLVLLAFWSHTEALFLLPLLLMTRVPWSTGTRPAALCSASLLIPVALGWVVRGRFLGTFALSYSGGVQAQPAAAERVFQFLPDLVMQTAAPWNRSDAVAGMEPLVPAGATAAVMALLPWVIIVGLALLRGDRTTRRTLLSTIAALAMLSIPAAFSFSLNEPNFDNRESRVLYPLMAVLAYGLAVAARGARAPRIVAAAFALLFALSMDALVQTARIESAAAARIETRLEGLHELAQREDKQAVIIAIDGQGTWAGIPLVAQHLRAAWAIPFRTAGTSVVVRQTRSLEEALEEDWLVQETRAVRLVAFTDDAWHPKSPILGPLPDRIAPLIPAPDLEGATRWKPSGDTPPRAVPGIRFRTDPNRGRDLEVLFRTDRGDVGYKLTLGPDDRDVVVLLNGEAPWTCGTRVRDVLARGSTLLSADDTPPELLTTTPSLPVPDSPTEDEQLPWDSIPTLALLDIPLGARIQLRFWLKLAHVSYRMDYEVPSEALRRLADGSVLYQPLPDHWTGTSFGKPLRFANLARLWREILDPYGVSRIDVRWRAKVLYPRGRAVRARTPWARFSLAQ